MKNNIKKIRESRGYSQEQLADRIGTTFQKISKLERGERKLSLQWMMDISKALGCSISDLISEPALVKLVGYVGAGAEIFPVDISGDEIIDEVDVPPGISPDQVVAVKVRGDSMYPAYREGDILYYHRKCDYDESYLRRECIVKVKDGAAYVKILTRGSKVGTFTLTSYNSPPIEDVQIEWACKILWVKKSQ